MNAHAVEVERRSRRPLMSGFHGMFSLGGLAAALFFTLLLGLGLPVRWAALAVALIFLAVWLWRTGSLLPGHETERVAVETRRSGLQLALHPIVLLVGALCVVSFLGEGAVLDWSALFLTTKGVAAAYGGLAYAAFSVAMVVGRLSGDRMTQWAGPRRMLRASAAVALLGWFAAVWLPGIAVLPGFVLIGFGASNIVPLLFSAAARVPGVPASVAIPVISALGYAGLLCGPAIVGLLAAASSLGIALLVVGLMLLTVIAGADRASQDEPCLDG